MKTYLQLNTSLHGADSLSSRLASQFIETLAQADRSDGAAAATPERPATCKARTCGSS